MSIIHQSCFNRELGRITENQLLKVIENQLCNMALFLNNKCHICHSADCYVYVAGKSAFKHGVDFGLSGYSWQFFKEEGLYLGLIRSNCGNYTSMSINKPTSEFDEGEKAHESLAYAAKKIVIQLNNGNIDENFKKLSTEENFQIIKDGKIDFLLGEGYGALGIYIEAHSGMLLNVDITARFNKDQIKSWLVVWCYECELKECFITKLLPLCSKLRYTGRFTQSLMTSSSNYVCIIAFA